MRAERSAWYRRRVQPLLVLWDVDNTLVDADGAGQRLYQHALDEMYGLRLPKAPRSFAGRTDSAIVREVLELAGVPDPELQVGPFQAFMTAKALDLFADVRARGRALPGAAAAVAALASALPGGQLYQSLLTGNIPELARVKLMAVGLTEHIDLSIGAYGDISAVRADLVDVARSKAAARHGADFGGRATVLIGDTPSDIEAAIASGASSVGVATGEFTLAELITAGADFGLPDLTDTRNVVESVLGATDA